ncbi:uncharacterized protein LOC117590363 isoform X1 [Drosophila guanche]|uniref:Uncharacterized protein n=2 Tax=Drosophila guanche TaxID=7266 RepID=A0A3B0KJM8_DROGU|nr:uncharacterized protein LOC117590363 isoform X1 [Drosophila guanche]SPP88770.1 Hypothetical predicted protein [Drosophila guanche]
MASNASKKKSSGMRILWIPGRKSHHPKGRLSTTSKHVSYSGPQKKSEVWSLGGSKAQTELIDFPMSEGLTATPSSSLSIVATCSLVQSVKHDHHNSIDDIVGLSETATLPAVPGAADTPPHSPLSEAPSTPSTKAMTSPNVITTAEVQNLHNFMSPDDLPKVPGHLAATAEAELALNSSAGTTASIATTSSPEANRKAEPQQMPATSHSQQTSPQKAKYKNNNNNQEDINSIESISSFPRFQGNTADFEWIDEMVQQRNCSELMHKNKRKKASKKAIESLEKDQLDGKTYDYKTKANIDNDDGDEKMVTCLYYSLMCCDCTIS